MKKSKKDQVYTIHTHTYPQPWKSASIFSPVCIYFISSFYSFFIVYQYFHDIVWLQCILFLLQMLRLVCCWWSNRIFFSCIVCFVQSRIWNWAIDSQSTGINLLHYVVISVVDVVAVMPFQPSILSMNECFTRFVNASLFVHRMSTIGFIVFRMNAA